MNSVYTLDDLVSREKLDDGADKPARLAVLGFPVAHSASPRMHQPALDSHGIDARYIRLEVEPGKIPEAFAKMRALGFIGCNVTVPHKLEAMQHCDVHPDAVSLGAVNTIRFDSDATHGFNTDGPGFVQLGPATTRTRALAELTSMLLSRSSFATRCGPCVGQANA